MPAHTYQVNDPVRFLSSRGKEEGFIINIRGSKADVAVADGTEYRVSLSYLRIRKGIAPKRVFTKDQMERLGFAIGDVVTFSANDGTKISGFIQRLNPQRARVHSDDSVWHVPYPLLEKERAEEQAQKNRRKLEKIANYADKQLDKHGLSSWRFRYDYAAGRSGLCSYENNTISMPEQFCLKSDQEEIKNTLLHEIAHALVGRKHGHDAIWRAKALEIGCDGERTHAKLFVPPNFIVRCKNCGWHIGRNQRRKHICRICRAPLTYELYTPTRWQSYQN